jgi:hypothetical protein
LDQKGEVDESDNDLDPELIEDSEEETPGPHGKLQTLIYIQGHSSVILLFYQSFIIFYYLPTRLGLSRAGSGRGNTRHDHWTVNMRMYIDIALTPCDDPALHYQLSSHRLPSMPSYCYLHVLKLVLKHLVVILLFLLILLITWPRVDIIT